MPTFMFKLAIGDQVTIKHDPTQTPKVIKAIYIDAKCAMYLCTDSKDSSYEYEEDLITIPEPESK